ncbi:UNVERIFIED_CONTAM: Vacuolar fusion protein mon1, partial [Siphonaria sp. JEL0065]
MAGDDELLLVPTSSTVPTTNNASVDTNGITPSTDTAEALVDAIFSLANNHSSAIVMNTLVDDEATDEENDIKQGEFHTKLQLESDDIPISSLDSIISWNTVTTWIAKRKHFFVLTSAGKPVFSRYGSESEVTELMGVFQTIISFFEHDTLDGDPQGDTIQSFSAGNHLFVFKVMGPIYLIGVSATGESEHELKRQLGYIYDQILSTTTLTQLIKIFEKRSNYDLRQLLTGTDPSIHKQINAFRKTPSLFLESTPTLCMPAKQRSRL